MSAAREFLDAWTLEREPQPISDADAAVLAEQWRVDAAQNGIDRAELDAAAGGDVAAYLQRTFGRSGSELSTG